MLNLSAAHCIAIGAEFGTSFEPSRHHPWRWRCDDQRIVVVDWEAVRPHRYVVHLETWSAERRHVPIWEFDGEFTIERPFDAADALRMILGWARERGHVGRLGVAA